VGTKKADFDFRRRLLTSSASSGMSIRAWAQGPAAGQVPESQAVSHDRSLLLRTGAAGAVARLINEAGCCCWHGCGASPIGRASVLVAPVGREVGSRRPTNQARDTDGLFHAGPGGFGQRSAAGLYHAASPRSIQSFLNHMC
jgi:hypothetical protein